MLPMHVDVCYIVQLELYDIYAYVVLHLVYVDPRSRD